MVSIQHVTYESGWTSLNKGITTTLNLESPGFDDTGDSSWNQTIILSTVVVLPVCSNGR